MIQKYSRRHSNKDRLGLKEKKKILANNCRGYSLIYFNYKQTNTKMGNICRQTHSKQKDLKSVFPLNTNFQLVEVPIEISPEHQQIIERTKKKLPVIDPREGRTFEWYMSTKYNLYFYGKLEKERPIGDCFFYTAKQDDEETPIIVTTNINKHFVFSDQTFILNRDNTAYFGEIRNNIQSLPRAEGKGILFSNDFVYEGDFKNGVPNGFGHYRSKNLQCVGEFKNGQPWGQCIQKTSKQLFLGQVKGDKEKKGFMITSKNKRIEVDFKKGSDIKSSPSKSRQNSKVKQTSSELKPSEEQIKPEEKQPEERKPAPWTVEFNVLEPKEESKEANE